MDAAGPLRIPDGSSSPPLPPPSPHEDDPCPGRNPSASGIRPRGVRRCPRRQSMSRVQGFPSQTLTHCFGGQSSMNTTTGSMSSLIARFASAGLRSINAATFLPKGLAIQYPICVPFRGVVRELSVPVFKVMLRPRAASLGGQYSPYSSHHCVCRALTEIHQCISACSQVHAIAAPILRRGRSHPPPPQTWDKLQCVSDCSGKRGRPGREAAPSSRTATQVSTLHGRGRPPGDKDMPGAGTTRGRRGRPSFG